MLKKRLIWQLYPSFLLIIIISMVGIVWYGSKSLRKFYLNQVSEGLNSRAHLIENQISENLAAENFAKLDSLCKQIGQASSTRITVILPDGRVIADSDEMPERMKNHADRPEIRGALEKDTGSSLRFSQTIGSKMMYLAIGVKQDNKVVAVARTSVSIDAIDEALKTIYQKLFWAALLIAIFTALISLIISRKISRPIEQMTEVAKHFADGNLDIRLPIPAAVELADLAKALNQMATQLNSRINTITEERSQIQAILSSMIEGVLAIDPAGHIVSINQAAAKLLGIDATTCCGLNIEEVVRNRQLQQYIKDTLANQNSTENENLTLQQDGRFLQLHGSALADSKGQSNGAVLVLHDITRTRRLEKVRQDFVANVSHELKTPVTSIKGFVETLLDGAMNEPQETEKFLQIISRHADRLNAIIEDLLSLSRLEEENNIRSLTFEETSVKSTLASSISLANVKADQKNITIKLSCNESISAKMNSALIEQAVLNLIDNATKYSQDGSEIIVSAEKQADKIVIKVSDQGCGIDKKHLERIFERFYVVDKGRSRKLGGTGLGLSIVKHIASVHGGCVTVDSKPGDGTTFTMKFPA